MGKGKKRKLTAREPLPLKEDYYVMQTQEVSVNAKGKVQVNNVSPRKGHIGWICLKTWEPPEDRVDLGLDSSFCQYDNTLYVPVYNENNWEDVDSHGSKGIKQGEKAKQTLCSRQPLQFWRLYCQDEYLDEILWHNSQGDMQDQAICTECWLRWISPAGVP
ncbi:hypothetical protein GYMLUDRAFT_61834 [Collybiopsis luxurians FD-317 M1]|uniref:Unplaced genomic scaffold GYMLUscaffold_47, whole genome shotgun sequence n=1 Tax=Collybiopsis luxurians FD-317 M1 TaxID=944289 RepID=A0A0D0B159_9AGAR|nr:hypothetical protein GYMLUDRAFT_61834 [Collybiopsis luxurians FD-317 M1]